MWLPPQPQVPVAVKSLRVVPEGPVGTELGDFLREVSVMMNLEHPHLLRLHGLVLGQPLQMVSKPALWFPGKPRGLSATGEWEASVLWGQTTGHAALFSHR